MVVGGEVVPCGGQFGHIALGGHAAVQGDDLGLAQPGEARQRGDGGRIGHGKKGHKNRIAGAVVHVRQQVQQAAFAQALDDGFDTIGAVEHAHLAKALATGHEPGIEHGIGVGGEDGGELARRVQRQRQAACVHAVKVRRKDDGGGVALQLVQGTGQLHAAAHQGFAAKPQPAAVDKGLAKHHKCFFGPGAALGSGHLGKAQLQIAQRNLAPGGGQNKQQAANPPADAAQHGQRQFGQQVHQGQAQAAGVHALSPGVAAGAAWRGCL